MVQVVVMAMPTTEATLTILGHGKKSESPGIWDNTGNKHILQTTPLIRVSRDPDIL